MKRPYRIESYIHSDSVSPNKAGALVMVSAETDFAVKTEEFSAFCEKIAKLACGFNTTKISELFEYNVDLEGEMAELKKSLKEEVKVEKIYLLSDKLFEEEE